MFASGKTAAAIVKEKGIEQLSDTGRDRSDLRSGDRRQSETGRGFPGGQCRVAEFPQRPGDEASKGKANPQLVGEILERKLKR